MTDDGPQAMSLFLQPRAWSFLMAGAMLAVVITAALNFKVASLFLVAFGVLCAAYIFSLTKHGLVVRDGRVFWYRLLGLPSYFLMVIPVFALFTFPAIEANDLALLATQICVFVGFGLAVLFAIADGIAWAAGRRLK